MWILLKQKIVKVNLWIQVREDGSAASDQPSDSQYESNDPSQSDDSQNTEIDKNQPIEPLMEDTNSVEDGSVSSPPQEDTSAQSGENQTDDNAASQAVNGGERGL